jgi:hypothetical protein
MLRLYGAAEGAGAFLATGTHRAAATNLRLALDSALLEAGWGGEGGPGARAPGALLRALPPRDALRLLGLLAGRRLDATYDFKNGLVGFAKLVGDLAPLVESAGLLDRGTDVGAFLEVDAVLAAASLHREPARAVRAYRSADRVAGVAAGLAGGAAALAARGAAAPCGSAGVAGLRREVGAAAAALAAQAAAGKERAHVLSRAAAAQLVAAQMALADAAGAAGAGGGAAM